ncbi:hypothetical protein K438DRAFT_946722 [Mycena galopus ATCC 62051]|nr:hypothetical protein K438DRAFT_946722 [Mycena galopus ATCC 62051]
MSCYQTVLTLFLLMHLQTTINASKRDALRCANIPYLSNSFSDTTGSRIELLGQWRSVPNQSTILKNRQRLADCCGRSGRNCRNPPNTCLTAVEPTIKSDLVRMKNVPCKMLTDLLNDWRIDWDSIAG